MVQMSLSRSLPVICATLVSLTGCGGSEFPVGKVSGKVMCEGKPVAFAMVFFEPLQTGKSAIVGKQGFGEANEQGEFVITSYSKGDGAVVGPHEVHVMPPHAEDHPRYQCNCEFNSQTQLIKVDVTNAKNEFTFDLPVKKSKSSGKLTADQLEALQEEKEYARQAKQ